MNKVKDVRELELKENEMSLLKPFGPSMLKLTSIFIMFTLRNKLLFNNSS